MTRPPTNKRGPEPWLSPPYGIDLTRPMKEVAKEARVCIHTVQRWRREAGIHIRPGPQTGTAFDDLSDVEWSLGCVYVARVIGCSKQRAHLVGKKKGKYPIKRRATP